MSVKFEKETIKQTGGTAASVLKGGKHDLADEIGTALTGGKGNIGAKGYLAVSDEALVAVWYCAYILLYRLPRPTADKSYANKDAHIWFTLRSTRIPGLVDREGS